jgi:hypothetical protein
MTAVAPLGQAVTAALEAAGLDAYRNAGPSDPESKIPYVVVYVQPPTLTGPIGAPNADAEVTVQLKYVSNSGDACDYVGDKARAAMLELTPPAGSVLQAPVTSEGGQPAREDPDTTLPLWMADELFSVLLTPA